MKILYMTASLLAAAVASPVFAEGDLSRANVIEVAMELGQNETGMFISPNSYVFETGQAYNLVITNTDEFKHELALNEMVERIFTRKIEISDSEGNLVAEIKGSIYEVEVGPGQTVQWFFVPVQTMETIEITCELPGHYESGMMATATIN
jgi:uncharacterized cupredoxin-like copper-binding protein